MSKTTLDEILAKHGAEPGEMTHSLKQAILRWVADEVIPTSKEILLTHNGKVFEDGYLKGREDLRNEQLIVLAQHGYKGGE